MYENEIAVLSSLVDGTGVEDERDVALNAAIALMRAAQSNHSIVSTVADAIAAVDVEMLAKGNVALKTPASILYRESVRLTHALSAAQAEIAHLELDRDHRAALMTETLAKLASAQAEIEHLESSEKRQHDLYMDTCDQRDAAESKITDLRAAAKRYHLYANVREPGGWLDHEFLAAIEDSK